MVLRDTIDVCTCRLCRSAPSTYSFVLDCVRDAQMYRGKHGGGAGLTSNKVCLLECFKTFTTVPGIGSWMSRRYRHDPGLESLVGGSGSCKQQGHDAGAFWERWRANG